MGARRNYSRIVSPIKPLAPRKHWKTERHFSFQSRPHEEMSWAHTHTQREFIHSLLGEQHWERSGCTLDEQHERLYWKGETVRRHKGRSERKGKRGNRSEWAESERERERGEEREERCLQKLKHLRPCCSFCCMKSRASYAQFAVNHGYYWRILSLLINLVIISKSSSL